MKSKPLIDIRCQFCHKQCFLPLIRLAPTHIITACATRRVNALATCKQGQALDRAALGYCYEDIVTTMPDYDQIVRARYKRRGWWERPIREWGWVKGLMKLANQ